MPIYRVQQTIGTVDQVGANAATNTWYCEADDVTAAAAFCTELQTFYNSCRPDFSSLVRQNVHGYKVYDMADAVPRAPKIDSSFNLAVAPTGNPLPPEVAVCVSFQGVRQSGASQARRRGRIYLPFLNTSAIGADGRPTSTTLDRIRNAADVLVTASKTGSATWNWVVRSEAGGGAVVSVSDGWVDNEWDTQRRRGRVPVVRWVFS